MEYHGLFYRYLEIPATCVITITTHIYSRRLINLQDLCDSGYVHTATYSCVNIKKKKNVKKCHVARVGELVALFEDNTTDSYGKNKRDISLYTGSNSRVKR